MTTILAELDGPTKVPEAHDPDTTSAYEVDWSIFLADTDGHGTAGTMTLSAWIVTGATEGVSDSGVVAAGINRVAITGGAVGVDVMLTNRITYTVAGFATPLTKDATLLITVAQR